MHGRTAFPGSTHAFNVVNNRANNIAAVNQINGAVYFTPHLFTLSNLSYIKKIIKMELNLTLSTDVV